MAKYRKSQGWAERKVNTACKKFINTYPIKPWTHYAAQPLLAEHRRAVRVVKQEIRKLEAIKSRSFCNAEIAEAYASITVLRDILALLQRGRE